MKKVNLILFSFLTLGFSAFAGDKTTVFKVEPTKSNLVWIGKKVTGEHKGNIAISAGTFSVINSKLSGGSFELNVADLTVTDIADAETNGKLVKHLKNDDFFATDKFPKANFIITSVNAKGANDYEITGNLTIKGITNPITFPATIKLDGKTLTAKGLITVNRTKFDIKFKSASFFENLGDKAIYDDFTLDVNLVANQ